MRLAKTEFGTRVLKERSLALSARQRGAMILCDGKRSRSEVLNLGKSIGVQESDILDLMQLGVVQAVMDEREAASARAAEAFHARSEQERYRDAYAVATRLTASLGLRGFTLNLAVERAGDYKQLCAVAPGIRSAVGEAAYKELHDMLYG